MSTLEPGNEGDEPRAGLSTGAIVALIVLAVVIILGGVCVFLVFAP